MTDLGRHGRTAYAEQVRGLIAGGADVLLIETQQDLLVIKCAIAAANRAMAKRGRRIPIMVQASFDTERRAADADRVGSVGACRGD